MKVKIRFALTKGDGWFPECSDLPKTKQNTKYMKSCMTFMPQFDEAEDVIEKWEIIDDGLGEMYYKDGVFHGVPTPIVEFTLKQKMNKQEFLRNVWTSSYKFHVPTLNDDEPYFYEDHNGYSSIVK
jgi:hypothetical protein